MTMLLSAATPMPELGLPAPVARRARLPFAADRSNAYVGKAGLARTHVATQVPPRGRPV